MIIPRLAIKWLTDWGWGVGSGNSWSVGVQVKWLMVWGGGVESGGSWSVKREIGIQSGGSGSWGLGTGGSWSVVGWVGKDHPFRVNRITRVKTVHSLVLCTWSTRMRFSQVSQFQKKKRVVTAQRKRNLEVNFSRRKTQGICQKI